MPKRKRCKSPNLDLIEDGFDDDLDSNDDKPGTPIQRNAANARERARMRVLSKAFFNLKRNIPWVPADTKLSKLDTLRLAKNYISYLAATLDGQPVENISTNLGQPAKTAWPFIFQPVQPHEATTKSSRLVPTVVHPTSSTRSDKNNGIKSQPQIAPSSASAGPPTTTDLASFEESRSLNQQYHHQHHQSAIVHHHRGHSSGGADASNHHQIHGYSQHLQQHPHLVHSMSD